jgi:TRAP-type C4-dicarboxylate transport system substrate-binding protein
MAGILVLLTLAATAVQPRTPARWDLPSAYPLTSFQAENLTLFARDVAAATGARLRITVHPNASLFKAPEIKRAVQGGQVPIGEVLLVNHENGNPLYGLDGIPFLATGYEGARRLYRASRPALEALLAQEGLALLYAVPWPPQGIFVARPLASVADMRGLKWRAYSPATARLAALIGGRAVTVEAAELAQALATGVVDAYMSSAATAFTSKTDEYLKLFYDTEAWLPKNAVIVNRAALAALDPTTREALLAAGRAAEARGWALSAEKNEWYKRGLRQRGMQILAPPPRLRADLEQVGAVMLGEWLRNAGPPGQRIVDAFRAP